MVLPFLALSWKDSPPKRSSASARLIDVFGQRQIQQSTETSKLPIQQLMECVDNCFFYGLLTEESDPLVQLEVKADVFQSRSADKLFTPRGKKWVSLGMMSSIWRPRRTATQAASAKQATSSGDDKIQEADLNDHVMYGVARITASRIEDG